MPRTTIVDGNSVIGSRPDGWWRDRAAATRRLVERLAAWAADADGPVIVVFDCPRPERFEEPRAVDVVFADRRGPDAADDVIAARVAADPQPARLDVVTSDVALAARVRAHGANVLPSRAFRDRLAGA